MEIVKKTIDDSHYYFVDNEFYPSVTRIIDEAGPKEYGLLNFFKTNTPEDIEDISSAAKKRGSIVHDSCEQLLNGVEIKIKDYDTDIKKKIVTFIKWYEETKPSNYLTEHTIASKTHKFAGTLDFVGTIGGTKVIIDFKTNKSGIYYSNKIQLMAYKLAYEEMTGEKIDECWILRLGTRHKVGYEFALIDDVTEADFLQVYKTYFTMNGGKIPDPPVIDEYPDTLKLDKISLKE